MLRSSVFSVADMKTIFESDDQLVRNSRVLQQIVTFCREKSNQRNRTETLVVLSNDPRKQ